VSRGLTGCGALGGRRSVLAPGWVTSQSRNRVTWVLGHLGEARGSGYLRRLRAPPHSGRSAPNADPPSFEGGGLIGALLCSARKAVG
jgi:hypothetical protein